MTLIIAFMYITLKLKEIFIVNIKKFSKKLWMVPVVISFLSIWVMHHPLIHEGMRIDLRDVPLFFIAYLMGWKYGWIAIILPLLYRYNLGGPTVIDGIIQSIILPFVIGAVFHRPKNFTPPNTLLNLKHMFIGFTVYQLVKSILMYFTTPATSLTILIMIVFEMIALLTITLINNDTNRNVLLRRELEILSRHDNMTSLYNLRYFKSKIDDLMKANKPSVIAMFDVDYFKNYNDTHGHPAGDVVLMTFGQLLKDSMRKRDLFARYGGEEFIICFGNVDTPHEASELADKFRNLVETYPFFGEEQQPNGKITISIGLSSVSNGKSLDELIQEADQALYQSKNAGRNRVSTYQS